MKIEAIVGIPRYDNHTEQKWIEKTPVTIEVTDRDEIDRLYLAFFEAVPCVDCRHYGGRFVCNRPCEAEDTGFGPLGLIGQCSDYKPKGDDDG